MYIDKQDKCSITLLYIYLKMHIYFVIDVESPEILK